MALPLLAPTGRHIGPLQFLHIADATPHTIGSGTTWNNLLYQSAVLALNPVAYWRMGEASGNVADSSGNGFTGTAHGTLTYAQSGAIANDPNAAILCDGSTGYFSVPVGSGSALDLTAVASIVAWVKLSALNVNNSVFNRGDVTDGKGFGLYVDNSNHAHIGQFGGGNLAGASALTTATWYCLAGITNGAASQVFVNGTRDDAGGTVTIPGGSNALAASIGTLFQGPGSGVSPSQFFAGDIDEVAVFNYALGAAQIKTLYTDGIDTSGQPPADNGGVLTAIQIVKPFAAGSFIEATVDGTQFNINASAPGQVLLDIGFSRNATIQASDNTGHAIVSYRTFL